MLFAFNVVKKKDSTIPLREAAKMRNRKMTEEEAAKMYELNRKLTYFYNNGGPIMDID